MLAWSWASGCRRRRCHFVPASQSPSVCTKRIDSLTSPFHSPSLPLPIQSHPDALPHHNLTPTAPAPVRGPDSSSPPAVCNTVATSRFVSSRLPRSDPLASTAVRRPPPTAAMVPPKEPVEPKLTSDESRLTSEKTSLELSRVPSKDNLKREEEKVAFDDDPQRPPLEAMRSLSMVSERHVYPDSEPDWPTEWRAYACLLGGFLL
jgi:hypothetical protein